MKENRILIEFYAIHTLFDIGTFYIYMDNEFVHMALKGETYCSIFGYTAKHQTW
jgi:hypothetical protein